MAKRGGSSSGAVVWLMLVVGLLLAGGWMLWTQDTRRGTRHPEYSVRRTDDRGSALVYRLYQSSGLAPKVWDADFTRLKEPGLLIVIAPASVVLPSPPQLALDTSAPWSVA